MAHAGVTVLLLLRNYFGHVSFATTEGALSSGLTEAAVDFAVHTAAHEVVQGMRGLFYLDLRGALLRKGEPSLASADPAPPAILAVGAALAAQEQGMARDNSEGGED